MLRPGIIARDFARSAAAYGEPPFHALLARRLAAMVLKGDRRFSSVLEIGFHTGLQTRALRQAFAPGGRLVLSDLHAAGRGCLGEALPPGAILVMADGERPPFRHDSFDLVYAGGVFQWFSDAPVALESLLKLLKPGGWLAFSQFLEPSLEPLKAAFREAGEGGRFLPLFAEREWRGMIGRHRVLDSALADETHFYPRLAFLMAALRALGATASPLRARRIPRAACEHIRGAMERDRGPAGLPLRLCAGLGLLQKT